MQFVKLAYPIVFKTGTRRVGHFFLPAVFAVIALATMAADRPVATDGLNKPQMPEVRPGKKHPITWDAMEKTVATEYGDEKADFTFIATNASDQSVSIDEVTPSCRCTVTDMIEKPWILSPGESGELHATVNISGKTGSLTKTLLIHSPEGLQTLFLKVKIAPMDEASRSNNQKIALADRQAVFMGDCASCHVTPAVGKKSEDLFKAACAICHASEHRASMVPDLWTTHEKRDAAYWTQWITEGKEGTLMPGFSEKQGGPLNTEQIQSLAEYLLASLPSEPVNREKTSSK